MDWHTIWYICSPQDELYFGDHLTFPLVPPLAQILNVSKTLVYNHLPANFMTFPSASAVFVVWCLLPNVSMLTWACSSKHCCAWVQPHRDANMARKLNCYQFSDWLTTLFTGGDMFVALFITTCNFGVHGQKYILLPSLWLWIRATLSYYLKSVWFLKMTCSIMYSIYHYQINRAWP